MWKFKFKQKLIQGRTYNRKNVLETQSVVEKLLVLKESSTTVFENDLKSRNNVIRVDDVAGTWYN